MNIPAKVINRLTLYHFILDNIREDEKYLSSSKIAQLLHIDASQVRKDIKYLNNSGICRVGYDVKKLKAAIEKNLGCKKEKGAFIIGAGNLGSALAGYDSFSKYGLNLLAMFDNDSKKIGKVINGKEVYNIHKVGVMAKKMNVDIAILTVPRYSANATALYLAGCGFKYIWNFAPCILEVPDDVNVWNENLISSFLQFTNSDDNVEDK